MSKNNSSFQDLEKQLAKDTLEEALKDLHDEITKDIDKNKKDFSGEIQKSLESFRKNIEASVSDEMDKKLSVLFTKHFKDTSLQVKESFQEMFSPVLKSTQDDMARLHIQGEATLTSWKAMMVQYTNLWTKPFALAFFAAAFAGTIIFFVWTYLLWGKYTHEIQNYENRLAFNESMLLWYFEQHKENPEVLKKGNPGTSNGSKTQGSTKKAKK